MRYRLRKPIKSKVPFINKLEPGVSYNGFVQVYYGQEGPVTVEEMYLQHPDLFDVIDVLSIKTQIVVNLTAQYTELQKYYGFSEDAMAEKISELAEKICSKI